MGFRFEVLDDTTIREVHSFCRRTASHGARVAGKRWAELSDYMAETGPPSPPLCAAIVFLLVTLATARLYGRSCARELKARHAKAL